MRDVQDNDSRICEEDEDEEDDEDAYLQGAPAKRESAMNLNQSRSNINQHNIQIGT